MNKERTAVISAGGKEYTLPLTSPLDLADYKIAIMDALYKGTKRNVESEQDPKNAEVG